MSRVDLGEALASPSPDWPLMRTSAQRVLASASSSTANLSLQDINMRKAFKSSTIQDQQANSFYVRMSSLQDRVDLLAVKVTQLDSTIEEVSLQDINMRKAFKSSTIQDQQVVSRSSVPNPVVEMYHRCDKPPPLNILSPYRDDKKEALNCPAHPDRPLSRQAAPRSPLSIEQQKHSEDPGREVKKVRKARNRRQEWNVLAYDKEFRPDARLTPRPSTPPPPPRPTPRPPPPPPRAGRQLLPLPPRRRRPPTTSPPPPHPPPAAPLLPPPPPSPPPPSPRPSAYGSPGHAPSGEAPPPGRKGTAILGLMPMSDARSDLLAAIRRGIQLRKVQEQREQEAKREPVGNDVATILSRRIAVEYSESDDDSELDDNDWSD
ncbi:hypothetical protein CRUP_015178 [Coryphaenoides rupestris]|nr:hypothetical protein CRUP_015178 [Coryphaenoides rupestris]